MSKMPAITIGFGILLIVIGLISYFGTDGGSITALIPAFIGLPVILAGFAMSNPKYRTWSLYGAAALSLAMIAGSFRGISGFFNSLSSGATVTYPQIIQVVLAVLALVFLVLVIRTILSERRVRA